MNKRQNHKRKYKVTGRSPSRSIDEINIGNISGGTGFAIGRGAQSNVIQTAAMTADAIANAFEAIQQKINAMPDGSYKNVAENAITALETEARMGEDASESEVQRWINFLAEIAPDAWEVAINIFANPIMGVGTVFRKIAERAKAGQNASKSKVSKK